MADDSTEISDQFKGLPMEDLIGGPLKAAVEANVMLAQSTATFINTVGFNQVTNDDKSVTAGSTRMVNFEFERPGIDVDKDGQQIRTVESVKLKVPILAIVPIPNLQIDNVDISFDMEVKSSTASKTSSDKSGSLEASGKVGWGPFSAKVKISGSISTHKENTRSTDKSAKYHVEVHATNHGTPEGLARVLDIMATAAKPLAVASAPVNSITGEASRDAKTGELQNLTAVNPDGSTQSSSTSSQPTT